MIRHAIPAACLVMGVAACQAQVAAPPPPQGQAQAGAIQEHSTQMTRITSPAPLHSAPNDSAPVQIILPASAVVQRMGAAGATWAEIRATAGQKQYQGFVRADRLSD